VIPENIHTYMYFGILSERRGALTSWTGILKGVNLGREVQL